MDCTKRPRSSTCEIAPALQPAPPAPVPATSPTTPARSTRVAIAIAVAVAAGTYVWAYAQSNTDFVSDCGRVGGARRALWNDEDPYRVVGPRGSFLWKWPL